MVCLLGMIICHVLWDRLCFFCVSFYLRLPFTKKIFLMMDMSDAILWDQINEDIEDADEQNQVVVDILPKRNPFDLSEQKFIKMFRLSKALTRQLINIVQCYVQAPTRVSALTVETKVLATLRFLATGSYQEITGSNHFIGISQASMSRCLREICKVLNNPEIFNQWVYFPRNMEELENIRQSFYEKYQFPGIVGIVDCTHVAIVSPKVHNEEQPERAYVNRKNYHSLNVQLICDSTLRIINVNARFPGSTHDSFIWSQSKVSETLERIYRRNSTNSFFVIGDSGYPTRPWILTPIPDPETPEEERFNQRFCSIRSGIERCNGVIKNRFRCLLKHRVLHYSPSVAATIINACVVLHNMCIEAGIPEPQEENEDIVVVDYGIYAPTSGPGVQINNVRVNQDLIAARQLRMNIIDNHFRH